MTHFTQVVTSVYLNLSTFRNKAIESQTESAVMAGSCASYCWERWLV